MKKLTTILSTTLLLSLIYLCSCDSKVSEPGEETPDFELNAADIVIGPSGQAVNLDITTRYGWVVDIPETADWINISSMAGSGSGTLSFSADPLTLRELRGPVTVGFTYNGNFRAEVSVKQIPANGDPTVPSLQYPSNRQTDIGRYPVLEWSPSTDPDGDKVYYTVSVSKDNTTWTEYPNISTNSFGFSESLNGNSEYYWKITATDIFGGRAESATYSFTTSQATAYSDGEYHIVRNSTGDGSKPIHLIFLGDGFIEEDYAYGGTFDSIVEAAATAFFDVEPYTTYKDDFRVSKVAAFSRERGATIKNRFNSGHGPQTKNTAFSSVLDGGNSTRIDCDYDKVFEYAQKVDGVTEEDLRNTTVILLINLDVWAGTCMMSYYGESVSMCPIGDAMIQIVNHEAGGHGFGRLADEYRSYNGTVPQSDISDINTWRNGDAWSFASNITFNTSSSHWNRYVGAEGYDAVGYYEGGHYYYRGVWRPEEISCMEDNRPYYNAPSREAIVRRIMKASGKRFNLTDFYSKDVINLPVATKNFAAPVQPLGSPRMTMEKLLK